MGLENPIHLAFLLILLLVVFGAKRLPEMGRSLGDGLRGFKESVSGEGPGQSEITETTAPHEALIADRQDGAAVAVPVRQDQPAGTQAQ